tara:strand:+ start:855 stop:1061 length:207 start_codon:yes stop_codon:yes gene_type:complete
MNLEDFMWKRAWSYIHEQYVKIIKIRQDSKGVALYDAQVLNSAEEGKTYMFRETELGNIQWIPYGSKR